MRLNIENDIFVRYSTRIWNFIWQPQANLKKHTKQIINTLEANLIKKRSIVINYQYQELKEDIFIGSSHIQSSMEDIELLCDKNKKLD